MTDEWIQFLRVNWGITLVASTALIQISPLKLNPWSAIAKWLKSAIGISELTEKVDKLSSRVDEREAVSVRMRILRFADELRHGANASKDHFDQMMSDCTYYEHYCDAHPNFKNKITVASVKLIESEYERCMREDDFLK